MFIDQKSSQKQYLDRQNVLLKAKAKTIEKERMQAINESGRIQVMIEKQRKINRKRAEERMVLNKQIHYHQRVLNDLAKDCKNKQDERNELKEEIACEKDLKAEIRSIVNRYKRLLTEHTKAKERLIQQVKGT